MVNVSTDTVREWAARLFDEAQAFDLFPNPVQAQNILMLAECVSAAATGYLIKQKMEGIIHGQKQAQPHQTDRRS